MSDGTVEHKDSKGGTAFRLGRSAAILRWFRGMEGNDSSFESISKA